MTPQDPTPEGTEFVQSTLDETLLWLGKAQESDPEGWSRLSLKIEGFLRRMFHGARLPSAWDFDDFIREVELKLLEGLPSFQVRGDSSRQFWAWLKKLASNVLISGFRRDQAQKRNGGKRPLQQCDTEGGNRLDLLGSPETPSLHLQYRELAQAESECIEGLRSPEQREAYKLHRAGFSYGEIARKLGRKTPEAAKFLCFRARRRIQEELRRRLDGYSVFLDRPD